ncbi:MAG: GNAT family N-acetyltransferase [Chloroflexi bacterium]|nr:GNAT family N-acetyltransferase [Chloroflexota bacterium]
MYSVRAMNAAEIEGPRLDEALDVFSAAIGFPRRHTRVVGLGDTMRRHAPRSGFKALGAFDSADTLVGFTYGYTSQPGLWWREQIVSGLSTEQRDFWLADAFELAELHVHPSAQGNHLGSQLHDGLLRDLPHATALLSVMHRSDRAKQLYASRGWQVLIQELRFSTDPATPFSVLGLEL